MSNTCCPRCKSCAFHGMLWMGNYLGRFCTECRKVFNKPKDITREQISAYLGYTGE